MPRKLLLASLCFTLFALVPAAKAQITVTVNTNYWTGTSPYAQTGAYFYSKLCNRTTGYCNQQPSNSLGWADYTSLPPGSYNGFVWHGTDYGSEAVPIGMYTIYDSPPNAQHQYMTFVAYPRPLVPTLQSCNYVGACTYPAMTPFDLLWSNAQDAARTAAGWTMTYDILTATKPAGGTWGPMLVTVPDAPCNPNSAGKCRWHVDGLAAIAGGAEYQWKIRAKLSFSGETYIYTTDSGIGHAYQTP